MIGSIDIVESAGHWLRQTLYGFGVRGVLLDGILAFVAVFVVANFALANGGLMSFVWRREMALIQDRWGPNRVGPQGLFQFLADGIKMITKQAMIPRHADRLVFIIAPAVAAFPFVMAYLVIPFSHGSSLADVNVGVLYLFAITSLAFPAVFMAGWSSNNKYAMMGGMRAIAQLLAFEVPLTMSALGVVMLAGTLSTQGVVVAQHHLWFIIPQVLGAGIFFIAGMAENAAHPFDLPEAESELVAGYYTEYSGIMFGLFFLAELGTTWTLGAVFTTFFLGGWQPPVLGLFDIPLFWFLAKSYLMFGVFTLARFSMPRFRIDQFLGFGWKILTPLAFLNLLVAAVEVLWFGNVFKA
ncbi:MAG: NADH-quinone oxidoreductase subunit [Chloroflexota bacterium]|jgi:NADH-quinone oxidoreductase subunit H|nr:NADH-quinone oxidoreductase subunit [Chloroflexota bacterium]